MCSCYRSSSHCVVVTGRGNIKLIVDRETNFRLSFLDCHVYRVNGKLFRSVYRKSTFSWLGGNFFSFCSFSFKLNSVSRLLSRGFKISSTYLDMCDELDFLRSVFTNIGFPLSLINSRIKKVLCTIFVPQSDIVSSVNKFYFTLPYFGAQ